MSKRQVKLTATWSWIASKRRCLGSQDLPNGVGNALQAAISRSDQCRFKCAGLSRPQRVFAIPMATTMFSKIDVLLRLYLTIKATTSTAERSVSALCRFKLIFDLHTSRLL